MGVGWGDGNGGRSLPVASSLWKSGSTNPLRRLTVHLHLCHLVPPPSPAAAGMKGSKYACVQATEDDAAIPGCRAFDHRESGTRQARDDDGAPLGLL